MQKFFKVLSKCLAAFSAAVFILAGFAEYAVPDEITTVERQNFSHKGVIYLKRSGDATLTSGKTEDTENYDLNVSLFNVIPLRKTKVYTQKRRYVTLCGEVFGIKLYSKGVLVISTEDIETENGLRNPGKEAGIKPGDIIKKIGNKSVNSNKEVSEICRNSENKELVFTIIRDSKERTLILKTVKEKSTSLYRAGLWVRDSTAGIGTMTFYERDTGIFASLGHAICDVDTGKAVPLNEGEAIGARIIGCTEGTQNETGEITGVFTGEKIGNLYKNSLSGVYGVLDDYDKNSDLIPVATSSEVKEGKAQILCSVDDTGRKYYDVEITKILDRNSEQKNMTVKITDKRLLEITGGIIQGMSGTPLIQDGMLVGAITHVFVGNATEGYAILAENMLSAADEVKNSIKVKNAS